MHEIERIAEVMEAGVQLRRRVLAQPAPILAVVDVVTRATQMGQTIFFCGNGGSCADAMHLAGEWTVRLRSKVERPSWPAMALAADAVTISAGGNDYGYEQVFARPLGGLGRAGDVLIGITTSGKSPNVLAAFRKAREMGIRCVGFLGGDGGPAKDLCDHAIIVPSAETARVQEVHITLGHLILELAEDRLAK
jgi:D-sedoheptulose 7-phosphate isomerase